MKLIAFQPSNKWDSLKRNAILLVTLGVVIVFGVLLFTLPISSMRAISSVGRKLSVVGKKTLEIGVNASTKAIETSARTIKAVGEIATSGMVKITEKATDMIEFITDMIQSMYRAYGKIVKFTVTSTQELVRIVSNASEFVLENMSKVSRMTVSAVKSGFEAVMKTIMKTQETLSDAMQYCFVPAMENFLKTTYGMAQVGVKIYTRYLPALVRYMYFFSKVAISTSVGNASSQVYLSFLALFAGLFTKVVSLSQTNLGEITTAVSSGISNVVPIFIDMVKDLSGDLCEIVVGLVDGATDFFPTLPVGIDLDACSTEAITMGLKWMSMGSICGKGYPNTASNFSTCMFNQVANVSFIPSVGESFGVASFVSGIPSFASSLLNGLGSVSFSIPTFSLSSLVGGLQGLITTLLSQMESWIFSVSKASQDLIFSVVSRPDTSLTLFRLIFQLIYRLLENTASAYLTIVLNKANSVVQDMCNRISGVCLSLPIPDNLDCCCGCVDFGFYEVCGCVCPCPKTYCISDFFSCSSINFSFITDFIVGLLGIGVANLSSVLSRFISIFLGSFNFGEGSW